MVAIAVTSLVAGGVVGMSSQAFAAPAKQHVQLSWSSRDIILGMAGQGALASAHPEIVAFHEKADPAWVDQFLAIAEKVEPGFAANFHAALTSGDPYQVKAGLADFTAVAQKADRIAAASPTATKVPAMPNDDFWVVSEAVIITDIAGAAAAVVAAIAVVLPVAALAPASTGDLSVEQYVASVTTALAP
jgi:SdpC family antimicrobial peptide